MFKHEEKRFWVMMEIIQIMVAKGSCEDFDKAFDKMEEEIKAGTKTLTQMLEETFECGFQAHLPLRSFYAEMKKSGLDLEEQ